MSTNEIITNNDRQSASRGMLRRLAQVIVASSLALAAVFATSAAPASAATYVGQAGQLGSVTLNGPMLNAYVVGRPGLGYSTFFSKNFNVGGFIVARSPSSYSQVVVGAAYIQRWTGSTWVTVQSRNWSGTVSGNGGYRFPAWTWSPTQVPNNRYLYRVVFGIGWADSSSGRTLATTYIAPTTVADNLCSTPNPNLPCASYNYGVNF